MANQYNFRSLYYGAAQMVKMERDSRALIVAKQIASDALIEISNMRNWKFLERNWFLETTANKYEYALPNNVDRVIFMYSKESNRRITLKDSNVYDNLNPNMDTTSGPYHYIVRGVGVANQPYSLLSIVSDDETDTTQTLTINGWSHGRFVSESISLNGTTAVSSSYSYLYIHTAVLSAACAGTVTCTSNSAGVTNFTISAGSTSVSSFTQPSDLLSVVSTSTSDSSPLKVSVTGLSLVGGVSVQIREDIAFDGTTPVSSTNRFNQILGVVKNETTGAITVSGHNAVLWQGAPLEESTEHLLINLIPCPNERDTLLIRYKQKLFPLSEDTDPIAPFPQKFVPAIKHFIASFLYDYMGHNLDKARSEYARWLEAKKEFMYEDNMLRGSLQMVGKGESPLDVYSIHPYGNFSVQAGS